MSRISFSRDIDNTVIATMPDLGSSDQNETFVEWFQAKLSQLNSVGGFNNAEKQLRRSVQAARESTMETVRISADIRVLSIPKSIQVRSIEATPSVEPGEAAGSVKWTVLKYESSTAF